MKQIEVTLTGIEGGGLLTHNERLANKEDPLARELAALTKIRAKTDEILQQISRIELLGSLYETDDGLVGLPTWNVFRSIQDGARLFKLGKQVERGLFVAGADVVPIRHDGPIKPSDMYDAGCFDSRSVKVGQQKVTRTRPMFRNWTVTTSFILDGEALRADELDMVIEAAGRSIGVGDYRPRFGRYTATVT